MSMVRIRVSVRIKVRVSVRIRVVSLRIVSHWEVFWPGLRLWLALGIGLVLG